MGKSHLKLSLANRENIDAIGLVFGEIFTTFRTKSHLYRLTEQENVTKRIFLIDNGDKRDGLTEDEGRGFGDRLGKTTHQLWGVDNCIPRELAQDS
jgi:hypothetical protein